MKTTKSQEHHYVYRITNTRNGMHYYGSRSCKILPELDLGKKYYSTFTQPWFKQDQKENPQDYKYKIIKKNFKTRDEANNYESKLHLKFDVRSHSKFINLANQLPNGFSHKDRVTVINTLTGETKSVTRSEFKNNKNLVGHSKGRVTALNLITKEFETVDKSIFNKSEHLITFNNNKVCVLDKKSNTKKFVMVDDFRNNPDLEFHTKNMVTVKNKLTNKNEFVSREEFLSNNHLEHTAKNTVVAKNKITGKITRIQKSIFDESNDWVSLNLDNGLAKIINIFDSSGKLVKTYEGNFDPQCRKDKLPYAELSKSYKSGGTYKIYPTAQNNKSLNSRLTKNGNIKYVGWYAEIVK